MKLTSTEKKVKQALHALEEVISEYGQYLCKEDIEQVEYYGAMVGVLLFEGKFTSPGHFKDVPWMPVNVRYDHESIYGFVNECFACALWNKYNTATKFKLETISEEAQKNGIDAYVVNEFWSGPRTAQIKGGNIGTDRTIVLYDSYFKYRSNIVDRLVISDFRHKKAIYLDYPETKKMYYDTVCAYGHHKVSLATLKLNRLLWTQVIEDHDINNK